MIETKILPFQSCDVKFASAEGQFTGYGSVFGVKDSHKDIIMPGAYADFLRSGDPVHVYVNHGWKRGELPVGLWEGLSEDHAGLKGDAALQMQMPSAVDAYWAVKGGLVGGLSIGYALKEGDFEIKSDGTRVIHRVAYLKEISIVDVPSNSMAQVTSVKSGELLSLIDGIESIRDFENFLRDAGGLSKGAALALTARAKEVLTARDSQPEPTDAKALAQVAERLQRMTAAFR